VEKGFIGKTVFRITEDGYYEHTLGTETTTWWPSIIGLYKFKNYLFVRINGLRVHMIPKRELDTQQDFEKFCDEVFRLKENAKP